MIQKVLRCLMIGLAIGSVISQVCLALMNGFDDTILQVISWTVASALCGLISLIFEIGTLKHLTAMLLHCAGCLTIVVTTSYLLGYADSIGGTILEILPLFLLIYAVIYGGSCLFVKCDTKRINQKLSEK